MITLPITYITAIPSLSIWLTPGLYRCTGSRITNRCPNVKPSPTFPQHIAWGLLTFMDQSYLVGASNSETLSRRSHGFFDVFAYVGSVGIGGSVEESFAVDCRLKGTSL
jgi:hypothetical protein